MTKIFIPAVLLLFGSTALPGCKKVQYTPGFKSIHLTDRSRIYKPGTDAANNLHFRPIDADIWYPADAPANSSPLSLKYFLNLYGDRANFYTASAVGDSLPVQFARGFCSGFKCSTPAQLFDYNTSSYQNAAPAPGKFPLVIYLASYSNMGYENYKLFEDLAKQGYITLSVSSIGRYPGDMTMKNEDMLEQVDDALAAFKYLQNDKQIDFSKLALLGYSWGGVGNAVLAEKVDNISCIISFEGSEFHHYGSDKAEDADFDGIKNSAAFKNMFLHIPYFRLESAPVTPTTQKDSVFNFAQKLSGEHVVLKINSADHQDFCYLPVAVRASGKCDTGRLYNTISELTISYLNDHLKKAHSFNGVMNALLKDERIQK